MTSRLLWLGVAMAALLSLALAGAWFANAPGELAPSDSDRELGLAHASVQMHLVLRQRLAGEDRSATVERLAQVGEARREAAQWAAALFDARHEGARALAAGDEHGPILDAIGGERQSVDAERATLLLAYIVAQGRHKAAASPQVATYEASRLSPPNLPSSLRGLAEAARALVFSSGNHCALARESASASVPVTAADGVGEWFEGVDEQVALTDVEYARRLLVDGALACCALREGDAAEAGRRIEATALDAQELGLAAERVQLFQTLAATARGDRDAARTLAAGIDVEALTDADSDRLRMLRDAIAGSAEHGLHDAAFRLAERDWLLSAMLEAVVDAMDRDGLLERLEARPEVQAAQLLLAAEAQLFALASEIVPFFDHVHLER